MSLGVRELDALSRFLRDTRALKLKPNKKLKLWLVQELAIPIMGNHAVFTLESKSALRTALEELEPNWDVLSGVPKKLSRIAVSSHLKKDKLSSLNPDQEYLLASASNGLIQTKQGLLKLPRGFSARIPTNEIEVENYKCVIVVENLDVFDNCIDCLLQNGFSNALILYRGHEKSIGKGLKNFMKENGQLGYTIYYFPDMDPAGIKIAYSTRGITGIIGIDISANLPHLSTLINSETYNEQYLETEFCRNIDTAQRELVEWILENNVAITQQQLIAHNLPLKTYKI